MIDVSVSKISIPNSEIRTNMVRKFIRLKLKSVERNFRELVEDVVNGKKISSCDYNNCITKLVMEYENEARSCNIPELFINKFSVWHTPKINEIRDLTDFISRSSIYEDTHEKISAILNIILMVLHLTLMDAQNVVMSMNGELDGVLKNLRSKNWNDPSE